MTVSYAVVFSTLSNRGNDETATAEPVPAVASPLRSSHVVELIDTECLLDPRPRPETGLPFDPTEPLEPAVATTLTDDKPTAPPPRPISASPALAPSPRALSEPSLAPQPRAIPHD
jgi:hypothetical protein